MERESEKYFKKFRAHIERYVKIQDAEFELIGRFFTINKVSKKAFLLVPGLVCHFENFVVSGLFQSGVLDESGKIHTLNFPHEDWWVGDYKSFSTKTSSSMRIEALEDSVLLGINKTALDELLASSPAFTAYFRTLSENASMAANQRIINQLSQTAEKRYELFCQNYFQLTQRLSQKRIASFLGISAEYFNQIEKRNKSKT